LWATGKHEEARELIRRIYTPFLDSPLSRDGVDHNLVAFSFLLRERGEGLDGCEPFLREAVVVARAVHGEDSLDLARALTHLGRLIAERGDSAEAEALLKEAVTIHRSHVGDERPEAQSSLDSLLDILRAQGKMDEVRRYASELLTRRRRAAQQPDADGDVLNRYAWMLLTAAPADLRDPEAALEAAKKAVEKSGGTDAGILDTLALAYFMTGDTGKAIETQQKAVSLLPPGKSTFRTELEANLVKYRQAAEAEPTHHGQPLPTDTNDASTTPHDLPEFGG
jgi:tetratricopeptide (TPR) repeat protein